MTRGLLIFCALLHLCLGFAPTFMWSNKNYFSGNNQQILETTSFSEIENGLFGISKKSPISAISSQQPEVVVLFVQPKMTVEGFSTMVHANAVASLEKLMDNSESSFIVQYTANPKFATSFVEDAKLKLKPSSIIIASESVEATEIANFGEENTIERISIKSLGKLLQAPNNEILNNGKTDLIVVIFNADVNAESVSRRMSVISSICDIVKSSPYLAIYGSEEFTIRHRDTIDTKSFEMVEERKTQYNRSYKQVEQSVSDTMWPDRIVEALILMVPFIIIALVGICCTFGLQSDLKFELGKRN